MRHPKLADVKKPFADLFQIISDKVPPHIVCCLVLRPLTNISHVPCAIEHGSTADRRHAQGAWDCDNSCCIDFKSYLNRCTVLVNHAMQDPKLTDASSRFYNQPLAYALASFAYYRCFKCTVCMTRRAYFNEAYHDRAVLVR